MAIQSKSQFDPHAFLATVGEGRTIKTYRKGEIIFSQGDPCDSIFYIQSGQVRIIVRSEDGKEAIVAVVGAEGFFGESCLAGAIRRSATVAALSESVIVRLEKAAMLRVIREETAFSEVFITYLLSRTLRLQADLVDRLFNSAEKRLARKLLMLANFGKEEKTKQIERISQETLAEMIGTTRTRVSFFMNKFRKLGLIDYNGHIEVHASLLSAVLQEEASSIWAE